MPVANDQAQNLYKDLVQKGELPANQVPKPLISVLIPTYNHAKYVSATIESILAQTYTNWEAVIVNDGSTDATHITLSRFAAQDRRIRVFHKANGGTASALNMAIKHARGRWICWLSSDDLFEQDALAIFARAIEEHPEYQFFHSHFYALEEDTGEKVAVSPHRHMHIPNPLHQVIAFFVSNYVHGISIAVERQIILKAGSFDETLKYAQDVDMWMRISALTPSFFINKRTCTSRVSSASGTQAFPEAGPIEVARLYLNFLNKNRFPACFPWLNFNNLEDVLHAFQSVFRVTTNLNAHFYFGVGYTPALLDRMCEWLSFDCQSEMKTMILDRIEPVIDSVLNSSLPQEIKDAFLKLRLMRTIRMHYHAYDPFNQMIKHASKILNQKRNRQAEPILKYLRLYNYPSR
jgi:O-antigen biosynthesis protein